MVVFCARMWIHVNETGSGLASIISRRAPHDGICEMAVRYHIHQLLDEHCRVSIRSACDGAGTRAYTLEIDLLIDQLLNRSV